MKNIFKRKKKPVSRTLTYEPNTQKPLADYFGSPMVADVFAESEFEKDFEKDNDYTLFDHIKFIIQKYKVLIIIGAVAILALVLFLVIKFNT